MRAILLIVSCHLVLFSQNVLAYDNKVTHPHLTESAIEKAQLDDILKANLGLKEEIDTIVGQKTIVKWLESGAAKWGHILICDYLLTIDVRQ